LTQLSGFLQVSSTNKTDCHIIYYIITEILLKEALNVCQMFENCHFLANV
jgi:hypothetical protein